MVNANDHDLIIEIHANMKNMAKEVVDLRKDLEEKYVTKAEFNPVRNIAFTIVGTVGVAVLLGLLAVIIQKSG